MYNKLRNFDMIKNKYSFLWKNFVLHNLLCNDFFSSLYQKSAYLLSFVLLLFGKRYFALVLLCNSVRRISKIEKSFSNIILAHQISIFSKIRCRCYDCNILYNNFLDSIFFRKSRKVYIKSRVDDLVRLRHDKFDSNYSRQGHLIVLKKYNPKNSEKGVIALKYNDTFQVFPSIFNLNSILKEYRIVFEPSSYRNIHASLFLYANNGIHVFQATQEDDRIILEKLLPSFKCLDLGSGDWVDFRIFKERDSSKCFDIVMVASWARLKRHEVLFQAMEKLLNRGLRVKCALIGYPHDLSKNDILALADKYNVQSLIEIFENIKPEEVAQIIAASRLAVHLSRAEGTNKATYEALMCNVPIIVYKFNNGFRKNYINNNTGLFSDDIELDEKIEYVLSNLASFSPRSWLMKHSGYINSTNALNSFIKNIALISGEPWTADIVQKINKPNFYYANEEDRVAMDSAFEDLKRHLL